MRPSLLKLMSAPALTQDFATLLAHLDESEALLGLHAATLALPIPALSAWSPEQHLAHLALANELVARNITSLVRGSGPLVVEAGEPPAEALAILASGRIPRGRSQSPRIVRPPEAVQRAYLIEWLAGNRREFLQHAGNADAVARAHKKVPHQVLGPLTASQWVRFAAMHTGHHLEIVRELLASRA